MTKIIGIVLILGSCSMFGILYAKEIEKRINYLKEIKTYFIYMKNELEYKTNPVSELFYHLAKKARGNLGEFFDAVSDEAKMTEMDSFWEIWREKTEIYLKEEPWGKKDREEFMEFGKNIGYLDKKMQIENIILYMESLDLKIEEAGRTLKEKGKIYKTLGVMAGLVTVILLI